jgi:hypothetical protein
VEPGDSLGSYRKADIDLTIVGDRLFLFPVYRYILHGTKQITPEG